MPALWQEEGWLVMMYRMFEGIGDFWDPKFGWEMYDCRAVCFGADGELLIKYL